MRARPAVLAFLSAAAAFLVFVPSFFHGWLNWDDLLLVCENPHIRGIGWENLRWAFTASPAGAYQPLAYASYWLDFSLWGLDPKGYHMTNAFLHALNAALVFLAARKIMTLASPGREAEFGLEAGAVFAAVVFAVHPLRVESVSWVAERRDALCGVFWLGALLAYLRARAPGRPRTPSPAVYVLFIAACLAKGVAVTLPLVLLVLDAWPLRRRLAEAVREKIPMLAVGAALGALAVARQASERAAWGWGEHGLVSRLAQAAYALVFYVRTTVWPEGLSPFYELRPPLDPLEPRFLASAAAVAAFSALAWRGRRARPWLAAAASAYALVLLPVSGLMQAGAQLVADRYSYLACLPLAILSGAGLREGLRRPRPRAFAAAVAAAVSLALAAACVVQQSYWRDSEALWRRVLALDPRSPTGWINLGGALAARGRTKEAAEAFARALSSDPACPPLVARLSGLIAGGEGGATELLGVRAALGTRPVCRRGLANLGAASAQLGDRAAARRYLRLALAADPGDGVARHNLERLESQPR